MAYKHLGTQAWIGDTWIPYIHNTLSLDELYDKVKKAIFYIEDTSKRGSDALITLEFETYYTGLSELSRLRSLKEHLTSLPSESLRSNTNQLEPYQASHLKVLDLRSYLIEASFGNHEYGINEDLSLDLQEDIVLSPTDSNQDTIRHLVENALVSVDGFLYPVDRLNGRGFLKGAKETWRRKERLNKMMVWDFAQLGGVDWVGFEEASLTPIMRNNDDMAYEIVRYRFTSPTPLTGRTSFLVLGGVPLILNRCVDVYDEVTAILTIPLRLANRVIEGLKEQDRNGLVFEPNVDWRRADWKKLLTKGNSGLVLMGKDNVAFSKNPLSPTRLEGEYRYPYPPISPIIMSDLTNRNYQINGYNEKNCAIRINDAIRTYPFVDGKNSSITEENTPKPEFMDGWVIDIFSLEP